MAQGPEEILYQGVARQSSSIAGYVKGIMLCVLGGVGAWGLGQAELSFLDAVPLWVLIFLGVPTILYTWLRLVTTKFKVTSRRVETEVGILAKKLDSLELWRVLDVKYDQSVLDRITGNASITLIGTDQSDPELRLHGLPDHRKLFEAVRDAVQDARQRGRPMEMVNGEGFAEML